MVHSKSSLRADLAAGKTHQVIENLSACTSTDRDLHPEAIALSARYQNYLREKNSGRAAPGWLDVELNHIHAAALDLIGRLPDKGIPPASDWKKWAAIIVGAITFLAAVAEFSGYSLRDLFKKPEPTPTTQPETKSTDAPSQQTTHGSNSPIQNTGGGDAYYIAPDSDWEKAAKPKAKAKRDSTKK